MPTFTQRQKLRHPSHTQPKSPSLHNQGTHSGVQELLLLVMDNESVDGLFIQYLVPKG